MNSTRFLVSIAAVILIVSACGETRTSGFYAGAATTTRTDVSPMPIYTDTLSGETLPSVTDTLLNITFENVSVEPFGPGCVYPIYNGYMHIDNSMSEEPVVLLSSAGLLGDGIVQARFEIVDAPSHCVVGIVLRASSDENFLLLGVNSRGQYTVQRFLGGLWTPVMGLEPFESSRLLLFGRPGVEITAIIHGSYVDFLVNGQLVQVVRTDLPATGQVGVFVDGYANVNLDRLTVVPSE